MGCGNRGGTGGPCTAYTLLCKLHAVQVVHVRWQVVTRIHVDKVKTFSDASPATCLQSLPATNFPQEHIPSSQSCSSPLVTSGAAPENAIRAAAKIHRGCRQKCQRGVLAECKHVCATACMIVSYKLATCPSSPPHSQAMEGVSEAMAPAPTATGSMTVPFARASFHCRHWQGQTFSEAAPQRSMKLSPHHRF